MVFNRQDFWTTGFSVETEREALEICEADEDMDCCYVDMTTMAYAM